MNELPEFRFCPACGGVLVSSILKSGEPARLLCSSCGFVFYQDPKLAACSIVEVEGRIVLLQRGIRPEKGKWVIPGGFVDRGEEVKSAAVRETEEECGIRTRIRELLGIYSYPGSWWWSLSTLPNTSPAGHAPGTRAWICGWSPRRRSRGTNSRSRARRMP